MTLEKAIMVLKDRWFFGAYGGTYSCEEYTEALVMAISALRTQAGQAAQANYRQIAEALQGSGFQTFGQFLEALNQVKHAQEEAAKYKALYSDMVKEHAEDPCLACAKKPQITCRGRDCPGYIEGDHGEIDGKPIECHWSCMDLDWGDCPMMEGSPCKACYNNGFSEFELKEEEP